MMATDQAAEEGVVQAIGAAEDEIEVVVQKVKPKVTGSDGHQPETKMTI